MGSIPPPAGDEARGLARQLGISVTAASVLVARGWTCPDKASRFFEPKLAHLTPPDAMLDRAQAAERIARAVRGGEAITVFGDYDADGITSTAILTDVLRTLGAKVVPLLADRFAGGYGLSMPAVERVLETNPRVVVTCDCGSSDHERLEVLRHKGIDVVVIDHHRVPDEELPVLAFLNPHRPPCGFPYKGLASCGLALSVAAAVRTALGVTLDVRPWLDLVALGTIADVAPLDGDNRALVRAGLGVLASGVRPGIRALLEVAKHEAATMTGEDVAFRLAPRINAPGRLGKPDVALRLLLARSPQEARALATEVDALSEQRKTLDRAVLAEAIQMLEDPTRAALPVIVLGKQGWHPGVVGIVAGRLASRFGKPTIVVGMDGATGRGSARGPAGFPLHDALTRCQDSLLGFGGHQAAAGVHVEASRLEALADHFAVACQDLGATSAGEPVERQPDARLDEGDGPERVLQDLSRFEPCGHMNPAPLLGLHGLRLREAREVRGGHLQLDLEGSGRGGRLRGFAFDLGSRAKDLPDVVDVVGHLRWDTYRGGGAVEIRVERIGATLPA